MQSLNKELMTKGTAFLKRFADEFIDFNSDRLGEVNRIIGKAEERRKAREGRTQAETERHERQARRIRHARRNSCKKR